MDTTTLEIEFNITDPDVSTPDSNGIIANISVSYIYIDAPYYLY